MMYAFGLEEHVYNGSGSNVSNTYYYTLGGRLIGKFDGTNTQYYLTDAQGSVLTTFSNAATTISVLGNQTYGPYGNKLSSSGSIGTAKGYTGQYQDPSGLDYYNARYYDPVIGCFTSADTVQGNGQGMDPYAYVEGNPETFSDPTGHCGSWDWGCWGQSTWNGVVAVSNANNNVNHAIDSALLNTGDFLFGVTDSINDVKTLFNGKTSVWDKVGAGFDLAFNLVSDAAMFTGIGELAKVVDVGFKLGADVVKLGVNLFKKDAEKAVATEGKALLKQGVKAVAQDVAKACGGGLSFTAATTVATAQGAHAIASLHPGDKVWAYNPSTQKMELQPILHVWINHDNDLVDLTVASTVPGKKGQADQQTTEVIHTN